MTMRAFAIGLAMAVGMTGAAMAQDKTVELKLSNRRWPMPCDQPRSM